MKERIEILPHPDNPGGFLVALFSDSRGNAKKRADEIRKSVMAKLLEQGYLLKPTEVKWQDGGYYFEVVTKGEGPGLLEDLKRALNEI